MSLLQYHNCIYFKVYRTRLNRTTKDIVVTLIWQIYLLMESIETSLLNMQGVVIKLLNFAISYLLTNETFFYRKPA